MYAVIQTGGKQYKVVAGEKIKVEQIAADVGQEITLDQVLAIGSGADLTVGSPLVAGALVKATVLAQGKHDKVHIFKMRRRKHYRKSQGHRQTDTDCPPKALTPSIFGWESRPLRVEPPPFFCAISNLRWASANQAVTAPISSSV